MNGLPMLMHINYITCFIKKYLVPLCFITPVKIVIVIGFSFFLHSCKKDCDSLKCTEGIFHKKSNCPFAGYFYPQSFNNSTDSVFTVFGDVPFIYNYKLICIEYEPYDNIMIYPCPTNNPITIKCIQTVKL